MMPSIMLDIITVCLLVLVSVSYAKKGLVYSVARLAGTIFSWAICYFYSKPIAQAVYFQYFRERIEKSIAENVTLFAKPGIDAFAESIKELTSKLPVFLSSAINAESGKYLEKWYAAVSSAGESNQAIVTAIAENTIDPIAIGLLNVIVFLVMFAICSYVVNLICSLLKGVNYIPIVGSLNSILGAGLGLVWGILYIYIISAVVWLLIMVTGDNLGIINSEIIEQSYLFKLFYLSGPWMEEIITKI